MTGIELQNSGIRNDFSTIGATITVLTHTKLGLLWNN